MMPTHKPRTFRTSIPMTKDKLALPFGVFRTGCFGLIVRECADYCGVDEAAVLAHITKGEIRAESFLGIPRVGVKIWLEWG